MDNELLQRYVDGTVTAEEIETVVDWLDADEAHVREFMALHKLNDISLFNKPSPTSIPSEKKSFRYRKLIYETLKIAAVFLIVFLGMKYFTEKPEAEDMLTYQSLFVPPGQRAELTLPDSTKVWLNARTKLTYPVHFGKGERTVTLDGEAYFDVHHNEKQPFIVKTEKMDVRVLGTEFNVIAYAGYPVTEVSLLEGRVHLQAQGVTAAYSMNELEQVRLKEGRLYVSKISFMDYFKWKEGLLCFHNEAVSTIIEKLELYFDVQIDVQKRSLLSYRYTGKFRTKDGVEQVLKVLQLEHKFTYTRDNELNIITIK